MYLWELFRKLTSQGVQELSKRIEGNKVRLESMLPVHQLSKARIHIKYFFLSKN
jgi:hypothetical protein